MDGPVVELGHGLDLQMVAVDAEVALPLDVVRDVLGHVLRVVVGVLLL